MHYKKNLSNASNKGVITNNTNTQYFHAFLDCSDMTMVFFIPQFSMPTNIG